MGTFLATVALAVPAITASRGTFLSRVAEHGLARTPPAPRGNHSHSPESAFLESPDSLGANEVKR